MTSNQQKIFVGGMILGISLLMGWVLTREEKPAEVITEGSLLPDWSFTDAKGKSHQFSTYQGQVLLINFWATWCPPCREELPSLNSLAQTLQGLPVVFLTFSADDSWSPVQDMLSRQGYQLPVYADFQRKMARQFGTYKFPETYIADKSGVVRQKVMGATNWMAPDMIAFIKKLAKE
jgi:peroxiredoxin